MTFFKKHIFFCLNQRSNDKKCCNDAGATDMLLYTKQKIKELGLHGAGGVRVNRAGCLGRCKIGPNILIYPEGVWYTYQNESDIDEIIQSHIVEGKLVERLLQKETS